MNLPLSRSALPDARLPAYLQPPLPTVFTFEITARCQHHCAGCGNVFTHSNTELDIEGWRNIIARIRPYIHALRITGGEPTLHRQFESFLTEIDKLQVPFVVFTNGNWAHPDSLIKLFQNCTHLKGLLVSFHGGTPTAFQQFTHTDAFETVLSNIRRAASVGLRVATNTLLLSTTVGQLPKIADLLFQAGASNVSFGRYYGPHLERFSPSESQFSQALSQIASMRRMDQRISLSNCVPQCFSMEEDFGGGGCTSGFTHCTIGPLGDVRPCTHAELVLGHLPDDDLAVLWRSPALMHWRNRIPDACLNCAALNVCRGGCRAVAQKLNLSHDPMQRKALRRAKVSAMVEVAMSDMPRLRCEVKPTDFGVSLSGRGHYITLTDQSRPILERLDGNTSIAEILAEFGPGSLELIGGLVNQHLLELSRK